VKPRLEEQKAFGGTVVIRKKARRFNKPTWLIERYRNMSPEQKIDLVRELGRLAAELRKGWSDRHGKCPS
jgi:hypothetical protein